MPQWKGSYETEPSNPQRGWAYYNTKIRQSFIFDGNSWQIMAKDGKDGLNGQNGQDGQDGVNGSGIIWKGELSSAPYAPQTNWAYFNTVDGNSYIFNGKKWDFLAKSGQNSATGVSLWLGSLENEPKNPSEGSAYYNSTTKNAFIYSNGAWQTFAKDGVGLIWKGVWGSAPKNPEINWAYYNITEQTSYIWSGTSWDILSMSSGGNTTITVPVKWLGSFSTAPTNKAVGDAYYNSTAGASYIFDGSIWQQISKDGIDGSNISGDNGDDEPTTVTGYLIEWKGTSKTELDNPSAGWAYYNSQEKKSFIYDGTDWQIMAQDGEDGSGNGGSGSGSSSESGDNGFVYMGETSETIDGVTYTVKSYAEVYGEPYFYEYYRYYYTKGKLYKVCTYYHFSGANLDFKYTEFDVKNFSEWKEVIYYSSGTKNYENSYKDNQLSYYWEYYENGLTKASGVYTNGIETYQQTYEYYDNGTEKKQTTYSDGVLSSQTTYYDNGNTKIDNSYSNGVLSSQTTYYKNGNKKTYNRYEKCVPSYSYTYYDNKDNSQKSYLKYKTDGTLYSEEFKYTDGIVQLDIRYNTDGTIDEFTYYYPSGNKKYHYSDYGYFRTYSDAANSNNYDSEEDYTEQQAVAKLNELRPK